MAPSPSPTPSAPTHGGEEGSREHPVQAIQRQRYLQPGHPNTAVSHTTPANPSSSSMHSSTSSSAHDPQPQMNFPHQSRGGPGSVDIDIIVAHNQPNFSDQTTDFTRHSQAGSDSQSWWSRAFGQTEKEPPIPQRPQGRSLSLAYLQDTLPQFNSGPAERSLQTAIDSHIHAALCVKHAKFSRFLLHFHNHHVEDDYRRYFWSRMLRSWLCFVIVAGCIVLSSHLAGRFAAVGDGAPADGSARGWLLFTFACAAPLFLIGSTPAWLGDGRMSRFVHALSLMFIIVIAPVSSVVRYTNSTSTTVSAPFYIVSIVSSVFFMRLRFLYTVISILVAAPVWFVLAARDLGLSPDARGQYVQAGLSLIFACIVACFMAYDLERSMRTRYLSDSRFISITRNLQSQLDGLERSLLAASGKGGVNPADLDSPLEKAMLAVRNLILDRTVSPEHKAVLDVVMACLSSPNLLTPDLDVQVQRGQVSVDDEQEKWLFHEIARRPTVGDGQMQFVADNVDTDGRILASDLHLAPTGDLGDSTSSRRGSLTPGTLTATMELSTLSDIASSPSVAALLGRTLDYNFPIFDFSEACDGLPLLVLSHHLCVSSGLLSRLSLDPQLFVNCMASIERGYHAELPFHNSLHAADVLHCINYLVSKAPVRSIFSDLELLAVYVAAAVHDFDHPGVGNGFLVASADRKALLYNDKSVLENHHCAAAFEVMSRQQCSFLSKLDRADYKIVREAVIEMVLATDLSQHFSLLTMFKKKVLAAEKFDPVATREDRILLMQMLMKCSDVSNPTKAWPQYSRWIDRITQEWYLQGDREKALGLPVSPFMNRDSQSATNPASAQSGFINFIVAPLFDAFGSWADVTEIKKALDLNRGRWEAALLGQQQLQQIRRELAMQSDRRPSLPSPNASGPASDSSGYTPMRVPRRRNKSLSFIAELAEMPESEYHGTASSSLPSLSSVSTSVTTVLVDDSTGTQTRGLPTKTLMDRRKSGPVPFPTVSEEREDA